VVSQKRALSITLRRGRSCRRRFGKPREGICFRLRLRPDWGGDLAASTPWLVTRWRETGPSSQTWPRKLYGVLPYVLKAGRYPFTGRWTKDSPADSAGAIGGSRPTAHRPPAALTQRRCLVPPAGPLIPNGPPMACAGPSVRVGPAAVIPNQLVS